jgi:hypothetical protein
MVPSFFRAAGIGSLAGALSGLVVGGLGGRLAMRIAAIVAGPVMVGETTENGNRVGDITVEGTVALIIIGGVFAGIVGGLAYEVVRPWFVTFGRWRGLVFGLVLLVAIGSVVINPDNIDFRRFGSPALNTFLFAVLFILFGVVLAPIEERLRRAVPDLPVRPHGIGTTIAEAAVILALLPAGLLAASAVVELVSLARGPIDASVTLPILIVVIVLTVLALRWMLEARDGTVNVHRRVGALGYAVLAVPIAVGGVESFRAISTILR